MNPDIRLYQDTIYLIKTFNTNPGFKAAFLDSLEKPRVIFRGRPLKLYTRLIASTDHQYLPFTKGHQNPEDIGKMFEHFYKNTFAFRRLEQKALAGVNFLPDEEHQNLEKIDRLPDGEQKVKAFEDLLKDSDEKENKDEKDKEEKEDTNKDKEQEEKEPQEELPTQTSEEVKEEIKDDKKKRGLFQLLRGNGGGFNLNLSTKWLKNLAQKAYQKLIQPLARLAGRLVSQAARVAIQTAGRVLSQMLPRLGNFAVNAGSRVLAQLGGRAIGSLIAASAGAILISLGIALVAFIGMTILAFFASQNPLNNPPTASKVDYKIAIRDTSIAVAAKRVQIVKDLVKQSWDKSKVDEYWDHIVERSTNEGWNTAFVLALWIEETGASHHTQIEYSQGGGVRNKEGKLSTGHLGCAPGEDQTIDESLNCLNNFFNLHFPNNSYTNDQFAKFMLIYSEGPQGVDFTKNPNFPFSFKSWYLTLIPIDQPGTIQPISPGEQFGIATACPTTGTITTPYGVNIEGYPIGESNVGCPEKTERCHSGIDIGNNYGHEVKSIIEGQVINYSQTDKDSRGIYVQIKNEVTLVSVIFEHLKDLDQKVIPSALNPYPKIQQGDLIGHVGDTGAAKNGGAHLHYRINQENFGGTLRNPLLYLGPSASLDSKVLTSSDKISDNNYSGIIPSTGNLDNWGTCTQSP